MKTYTMQKVIGQPDWSSIPSLPIDQVNNSDTTPPVRAWAQIAYGDDSFFVHLWAEEENIRMVEDGPLANTWEDSCLEFFFAPVEGDPRYFNLEMTPKCAYFLGVGTGKEDLVRLLPLFDIPGFAPRAEFFDGGWELFYEIPFALIRRILPAFAPKKGDTIRANCYKCGDNTVHPHWLSWSPVPVQPLNFHLTEYFGTMIFG